MNGNRRIGTGEPGLDSRAPGLGIAGASGLLALLLAACSGGGAASSDESSGPGARVLSQAALGPVEATLSMPDRELRFGDRVPFTFEVVARDAARVRPVDPGARLGHFRIRGKDGPKKDGARSRWTWTVEPELTGKNLGALPPLAFEVAAGEGSGQEHVLEMPPFEIDVAGLPEDEVPVLGTLADPLGPLPLPAPEGASRPIWIAAAALAALLAGACAWRLLRHRRRAAGPPPLDPTDEARRALDRLLASRLLADGRFGEFYVALTGIVRLFIERTTGIRAPEETTEEFLRDIEGRDVFAWERKRALGDFLAAADLVKYAAQVPREADVRDAVHAAKSFCGLAAAPAEAVRT